MNQFSPFRTNLEEEINTLSCRMKKKEKDYYDYCFVHHFSSRRRFLTSESRARSNYALLWRRKALVFAQHRLFDNKTVIRTIMSLVGLWTKITLQFELAQISSHEFNQVSSLLPLSGTCNFKRLRLFSFLFIPLTVYFQPCACQEEETINFFRPEAEKPNFSWLPVCQSE